jgi:pyocin large subunit-like protein
MSSPPLKSPPAVRWLSILVVVVAIVVRFWPHHPSGGNTPPVPAIARTEAASPAAAVPAMPQHAAAARYGASVGFRTRERLEEHFQKNGGEFHSASADDYLKLAQSLRDRTAGGDVRELVRADGVVCRFDRAGGAFIAFDDDGTIRTFFRPNDGERYFERQAGRAHGAP